MGDENQHDARLDIELLDGRAEGWQAASTKVLERAKAAFDCACQGCTELDDEADLLREVAAQLQQEADKLGLRVTKKRAEYKKKWGEL